MTDKHTGELMIPMTYVDEEKILFKVLYTSETDPTWVLKQQFRPATGQMSPVAYIWHEGCLIKSDCYCGGWSSTFDTLKGYCHHCGIAVPQDIIAVWVLYNGEKNEYYNQSKC